MARISLLLLSLACLALAPAASAGCVGGNTLCTNNYGFTDGECGAPDGWGSSGEWSALAATTDVAQASLSTSGNCYTYMGEGFGQYSISLHASAAGQGAMVQYGEFAEYHGTPDDVTHQCAASAYTWGAVNEWVFESVPAPVCGNVPHVHIPDLLP